MRRFIIWYYSQQNNSNWSFSPWINNFRYYFWNNILHMLTNFSYVSNRWPSRFAIHIFGFWNNWINRITYYDSILAHKYSVNLFLCIFLGLYKFNTFSLPIKEIRFVNWDKWYLDFWIKFLIFWRKFIKLWYDYNEIS